MLERQMTSEGADLSNVRETCKAEGMDGYCAQRNKLANDMVKLAAGLAVADAVLSGGRSKNWIA